MAKNVSIIEDGNSKIIENAAKIRTSLVGGGTCDWIPKDDVPLQKLTVTEDGTYRPEENYYGFSQVTARGIGNVIAGELIEKTITKNGTYNIKDESGNPYGYSKIIVNIDTSGDDSGGDSGGGDGGGGSGGITGKDEDGNDTMAETDEDGNIVMTALPTEIKVIIPPAKLEYNRYEEIDYSGISVYAYISKAVHWLGATTTGISEGSTNGTVVVDGKSISVSVGDGVTYSPAPAVTYRFVWDGTKWVNRSNYSAEKAIWKSDKYPTGKIPFEELIFPIKRINYTENVEQKKEIWSSSDLLYCPSKIRFDTGYNMTLSETITVTWKDRINEGYQTENKKADIQVQATYSAASTRDDVHMAVLDFNEKHPNYSNRTAMLLLLACSYESYLDGALNTGSDWWGLYLENSSLFVTFIPSPSDINNVVKFPHSHPEYYDDEPVYTIIDGRKILVRTKTFEYITYSDLNLFMSGAGYFIPVPYIYQRDIDYKYDKLYFTINGGLGASVSSIQNFTYMGKEVVYCTIRFTDIAHAGNNVKPDYSVSLNGPSYNIEDITEHRIYGGDTIHYDHMAWTMVYGDTDEIDYNGRVQVPVQWKRPGDGKILETTFTAWMKDDGSEAPQGGNG